MTGMLDGKAILVTGSAGGIGRTSARFLPTEILRTSCQVSLPTPAT